MIISIAKYPLHLKFYIRVFYSQMKIISVDRCNNNRLPRFSILYISDIFIVNLNQHIINEEKYFMYERIYLSCTNIKYSTILDA